MLIQTNSPAAVRPKSDRRPIFLIELFHGRYEQRHVQVFAALVGFMGMLLASNLVSNYHDVFLNPLVPALLLSLAPAILFPVMGAVGFNLGTSVKRKALLSSKSPQTRLARHGNNLKIGAGNFLIQALPFQSARFGYFASLFMLSCFPQSIGFSVVGFVHAAANDAHITNDIMPHPLLWTSVECIVALAIWLATNSFAVRLSAGYQRFLTIAFHNTAGDGWLQSFRHTLDTPAERIEIRSQHPHLRSFGESLIYLSVCYAFLFWLAAFSPIYAIKQWLLCSVRDANMPDAFYSAPQMQIFVASIVAAYGTVPFAVMTCAFLPLRKSSECLLSEQGILFPNRLFGKKLYFWSELNRLSLRNTFTGVETLELQFRGGTIRFDIADIGETKARRIIANADEYANGYELDASLGELTTALSKQTKFDSLAETKRFESTVFEPKRPGDYLQNGAFRIVRILSSKPLSAVYLVRSRSGIAAIAKQFTVPWDNPETAEQKILFRREYKTLSDLEHPGLAKVIDVFEEGESSFIVLEHIRGTEVRSLIESRGARNEKVAIAWALSICRQLCYMHSLNPPVLHRDLSPDNLILAENGEVRIIDFGAAHQFMEGVTGTLIGKQSYIAPEQLRGKPSARSDMYSFGATLFFITVGQDPKALKQCDPIESGARISKELNAIIKSCTEFHEEQRPLSMQVVLWELKQLSGASQVESIPVETSK